MKNKKLGMGLILAGLMLVQGAVYAEGIAAGVKVGTLGLGADVTVRLHNRFNIRGNLNWLKFDTDGTVDDVDFTYGLDLSSYGGLVDFHPFAGGFRISGGFLFGSNNTSLDGKLSDEQKIGDHTYTPEQIGTLSGNVKFDRNPAPYLGIGFGNAVDENQAFSFIFDIGVALQSYEVELTANGAASQSAQFQQDLAELEKEVQDTIDDWKIYPVLSFGFAYQF